MARNDALQIRFSRGSGSNFGKVENKVLPWSRFVEGFSRPTRTQEHFRHYLKMSDKEQQRLKAVDGFFYRTQVEGGTRNRSSGRPSDLITLDFDNATPEFLESLLDGSLCGDLEWFLHTTRRHTPEKPRIRVLIPTDKPITNDIYSAVSRIVCLRFDPDFSMVDKVSFRPAQMMFLPTVSSDSEYVHHRNLGDLMPWGADLDDFELLNGDWHDVANLPKCPGEELRNIAAKAEVPTEKPGPVGDFCRAYDIPTAIETFLPDVYEPTDDNATKPRYTYLGGTTTNGAEVQDDGLFLYSHHGSDPCSDMLVNSFDLVRIHKFGELDTAEDMEKGIGQRPSFKAMIDFIKDDENYAQQVIASRYDMTAMFDDADEAEGDEAPEPSEIDPDQEILDLLGVRAMPSQARKEHAELGELIDIDYLPAIPGKRRAKPPKDWHLGLERTKDGDIMSSSANITTIVQMDVRVNEAIEYNAFTQNIVTRIPLKTRMSIVPTLPVADTKNGDLWTDTHSRALRVMLESENGSGKLGWGLRVTDRDLDLAVDLTAQQNPFHPILDMLLRREWDGEHRIETLFIDYLGSPDDAYHRTIARLFFIAAVARVFEPGHKFDFVPILEGPQGLRKSTFIKVIACGWFGELTADLSDDKAMVENMQGHFIMELPELSSIKRSEVETVKAKVSQTSTTVRLAYGRRAMEYKRQCVFMGTTNEPAYLVDRTGNRRWWPVPVTVEDIDTDTLAREMPQIWAEAVILYRQMRAVHREGDLPLYIADLETRAQAEALQESRVLDDESDAMSGPLEEFLLQPLSRSKFDDGVAEYRDAVCVRQLWSEALNIGTIPSRMDSRHVGQALRRLGWFPAGTARVEGYGIPKAFRPHLKDRHGNPTKPISGKAWVKLWNEKNRPEDEDLI